ncbi:MAG TPA: YihY/virulence factor BrkB family protein [Nevskiaceae bacterium]|nr:YihY/virulence factor BrkB family protein [Nevskiaceae bacterium]
MRRWLRLAKLAASSWVDDAASSMGAAIAFYTLLSMAPLLLIVITLAGFVFGEDAAQGALLDELRGVFGDAGAQAVQAVLASSRESTGGVLSIVAGMVTLFIGATTVFAEIQSDLDRIWKVTSKNAPMGSFLRARLLSFGVIVGTGFLLIVSLAASAALSALGTWWSTRLGGVTWLLQVANFLLSYAVITALFAMIYKLLPSVAIRWRDVLTGAALTSLLFSIGKVLIGEYLGTAAIASSFGAAGTLVMMIVWVYYSAQIFLFGAELTHQYAMEHGSHGVAPAMRPAVG